MLFVYETSISEPILTTEVSIVAMNSMFSPGKYCTRISLNLLNGPKPNTSNVIFCNAHLVGEEGISFGLVFWMTWPSLVSNSTIWYLFVDAMQGSTYVVVMFLGCNGDVYNHSRKKRRESNITSIYLHLHRFLSPFELMCP